jgi:hypothetical protein
MKYVFVCGLQRSGTTVLVRNVGKLTNCTAFENTGAVMDEGQYLQDVYPPDSAYGGAGNFGFDPRAHLTEESTLLTPQNVSRLLRSWEVYWDRNKTIRVEKTPANLLKTRFLQAAFPDAYFIVIKRHPVPVSLASQKQWSRKPLHRLLDHWLRCHEIFDEDKTHLSRLYELSYEDFIKAPRKLLLEIATFLGTEFSDSLGGEITEVYNKQYFDRWDQMVRSSHFKSYYRCVAGLYEERFRKYGYSLAPLSSAAAFRSNGCQPICQPLLYLGAEGCCALWRAGIRLRGVASRCCPRTVRTMLRNLRPQST